MSGRRTQDASVVVVPEPFGPEGLELLKRGLSAALESGADAITVDTGDADLIDGACLEALLWAANSIPAGRTLSLHVSPELARSLHEWRIETVVGIVEADAPATESGKE